MDLGGLSGAIGGIVAVLILGWIVKRIRSTPEVSKDGQRVLRYHRSYEVIGWVCGGFFLILVGIYGLWRVDKERANGHAS